jgi:hypothetical protein
MIVSSVSLDHPLPPTPPGPHAHRHQRRRERGLTHSKEFTWSRAVFRTVTRGKLGFMQQDEHREGHMDDDSTHRPEDTDTRTEQSPVIRLLANPRRVRRA